jgi:hypothetical protein
MSERKQLLREIILDILAGRERTTFPPSQIGNLLSGVAEVLNRRQLKENSSLSMFPAQSELAYDDKLLAQEICWDLMVERVITPGMDFPNSELPYIRVHSEAVGKI